MPPDTCAATPVQPNLAFCASTGSGARAGEHDRPAGRKPQLATGEGEPAHSGDGTQLALGSHAASGFRTHACGRKPHAGIETASPGKVLTLPLSAPVHCTSGDSCMRESKLDVSAPEVEGQERVETHGSAPSMLAMTAVGGYCTIGGSRTRGGERDLQDGRAGWPIKPSVGAGVASGSRMHAGICEQVTSPDDTLMPPRASELVIPKGSCMYGGERDVRDGEQFVFC